jgi:D-alanyl-D-alanine endopeptidase (penicillin-binding protein 7)
MRSIDWRPASLTTILFVLLQTAPVATFAASTVKHAKPLTADQSLTEPLGASPAGSKHARVDFGEPGIRSKAAIVIDEANASVLYSRRADVASPIASITKLMTALVVLEAEQPLDEVLQITADDRDNERNSYSRLAAGTKLSRATLLHLALMSSENRAAHALGRNYPGGLTAFVTAMNAKAKALGMERAHFVDPTGLSSSNVATPEDLSKLVMAASKNRTIREYSTGKELTVKIGRQLMTFHNTNTLVSNPGWDVVLQKTGYINEAGRCLVMKTIIDGRAVVIVLLDSFGKYTRVADAKRIRTWVQARQLTARAR